MHFLPFTLWPNAHPKPLFLISILSIHTLYTSNDGPSAGREKGEKKRRSKKYCLPVSHLVSENEVMTAFATMRFGACWCKLVQGPVRLETKRVKTMEKKVEIADTEGQV